MMRTGGRGRPPLHNIISSEKNACIPFGCVLYCISCRAAQEDKKGGGRLAEYKVRQEAGVGHRQQDGAKPYGKVEK
jgi:hypothetical protein